jgi:uncharacterized protein YheU (UPF0270 family)
MLLKFTVNFAYWVSYHAQNVQGVFKMVRIRISPDKLSAKALEGVIDDFISREGTDYGHKDYSLAEKRQAVLTQINRGSAVISFDAESETTSIIDSALFGLP